MTRRSLFDVLRSLGAGNDTSVPSELPTANGNPQPSQPATTPGMPSLLDDAQLMARLQASMNAGIIDPEARPMTPLSVASTTVSAGDESVISGKITKRRINRGRAFKAHRGVYNVVIEGKILNADLAPDVLKKELLKKKVNLPPVVVKGVNIFPKLDGVIDLLPHLNNPSHCGAIVAGHLFPRDFFIDHILRDADGNVKAAKGFINHSNREPLSHTASQIFFDVLYYFGGVIIEPTMLESWLWVARKGVNDRGNTSKSGRGVRYFVNKDYEPILEYDYWINSTPASNSSDLSMGASSTLSLSTSTIAGLFKLPRAYLPARITQPSPMMYAPMPVPDLPYHPGIPF